MSENHRLTSFAPFITASYNALNQPVAIWAPAFGSNFLWLGYDPLGRCVKRWVGPGDGNASGGLRYFYYDGWNLIEDGTSPWNPEHFYVNGARIDEIVASYTWGVPSYHHYDANGNCMTLTNAAGNITEQYYYDAFGKPYMFDAMGNWLSASPSGNRFLFTGREYISELKLYDYRNRLYNPQMGRFLQPDPKEFGAGDYNLYRYCHNDPVNKSDPTGEYWSIDPKMGEDYAQRVQDQIDRARLIDPQIDKAFRTMEADDTKMDVFTLAGKEGNGTTTVYDWLGNPTGAIIRYDPDNWKVDSGYRDPVIGLVHELPHIPYANRGDLAGLYSPEHLRQEKEAIRLENVARRYIDGSHRDEDYRNHGPSSITYP